MNVVQAGPTPIVAAAAEAANRPAQQQVREAELPNKAVRASPQSEHTAKYAAQHHAGGHKPRGNRVDIEA